MPPFELDVEKARSHFPSLSDGYLFADNAGGSQCAKIVADKIYDYLLHSNVQLGADYSASVTSTTRVLKEGPEAASRLVNAASPDEIVFGASSTINLENLARGLEGDVKEGDEFIITGEHEANNGPWKKLAVRTGAVVKYWLPKPTVATNPYSVNYSIEELLPLVSPRTRLIAISATSNILGSIIPVKEVVRAVKAKAGEVGSGKVEISVDCVAYAPHRLIDVQDWDVDYCVFSYYKVYGSHISALYVRAASLQNSVRSIAHHFLKAHGVANQLQPGGPGYETVYGTTGVPEYLLGLAPSPPSDLGETRKTLETVFDAIAVHEQALIQPLLEYLTQPEQHARGIRVVGEETWGLTRVPTISFIVVAENGGKRIKSKDVVKVFDGKGKIGIRYGHFYAYTLVKNLFSADGFSEDDVEDGVVRISLVHYNTIAEVQRIIEILREVFGG